MQACKYDSISRNSGTESSRKPKTFPKLFARSSTGAHNINEILRIAVSRELLSHRQWNQKKPRSRRWSAADVQGGGLRAVVRLHAHSCIRYWSTSHLK